MGGDSHEHLKTGHAQLEQRGQLFHESFSWFEAQKKRDYSSARREEFGGRRLMKT
jgi:hypothetical protein